MKRNFIRIHLFITLALGTVVLSQCGTFEKPEPSSLSAEDSIPDNLVEEVVLDSTTTETAESVDTAAATKPIVATVKKQKPLTITITNLKSETAPIIFSVYEDEDTYLDPKAQLKTYRFVPKKKTLKITLTDLKFGTYAIAFYQDLNNSKAIDKNGLGIPTEPYAFSNDIRPKLSAPSFDDCKFEYNTKKNSITVAMGK
jgi:uncharacterized protein (DUF2141 family)